MAAQDTVEALAVKPKTVARLLDIGTTTVYQLIRDGQLRTVPFGADQRVLMEDVKRLAQEGWKR